MTVRAPLEKLLSSFSNKDLVTGNQLFKTLSAANVPLDDFASWLLDNRTFNLVKTPDAARSAFLLKHRADRERFKSRTKTPFNPCHGKDAKVEQ